MIKKLHAIFGGTVQGVGFRYTTERIARRYPVTGFVRNLANGKVELAAEGEELDLQAFLKAVQESSMSHYIDDVKVSWDAAEGKFQRFEVSL